MICYELWGNDTYSNEINLFGVYKHHSSAKRAKKNKKAVRSDCYGTNMRYSFWITKISLDDSDAAIQDRIEYVKANDMKLRAEKRLIIANLYEIYLFAKKNVNKIGQFNFPLSENFMDSQIKSIQFNVCPIKDSIDNVNLFLIIKFQNECNSKYVETGTLPEICSALESPDIVLMKSGLP